ncbi:hypothetical protein [Rathayibacter toxicus]|uniref:3-ketoacyl-ACP synthase n=1 Tax=Rathayibacter toxicus TaxID=145458 RepID=A0A0C5BA95_9MICO|nr:hypothetical protein [Rathayibacter toxicus]AJM77818.1 hypothetical protein TI83_07395 [Rathayibacter toxicus]ALS57998.1 hypothetical protein APU90_09680 [Rathayibacter toxicus]KKM44291.1 hypothetical protein VT73_10340 [Rathayibacter toxicus]PPG20316.1 3-ketoacyl-ACP synthase [Rathayibacter toxicus]PPG45417.1 3-ketoacyl-ACP synthase [Rathayibacter toxicus]
MTRVAVTGVTALTSLGDDLSSTFAAMLDGRDGFTDVGRFDVGDSPYHRAAAVDERLDVQALIERVVVSLGGGRELAVNRAYLAGESHGPYPTIPATIRLPRADREPSGWDRIYTGACVASSSALIDAAAAIAAGRARSVLLVAARTVDAVTFAPFAAASAMTLETVTRPLTTGRSGLLLGEGAAAMLLEAIDDEQPMVPPLAEIRGWGRAGDAFHVCQPEPSGRGMHRAIVSALARASLHPEDIGHVSVHGTGTLLNDAAEVAALETALGSRSEDVPVTSVKSALGHILEAAGLVEAVIAVQSLIAGIVPPHQGRRAGDTALLPGLVETVKPSEHLDNVLSLNLAFGGSNTAIILSRWGTP